MKKYVGPTAVGLTVVFCLWVFLFGLPKSVTKPTTVTATSTIERHERHGMYASGSNPRMAVDYTDRRDPNVIVYYIDEDSDGHVDEVSYCSTLGKKHITFTLSANERLTEKANGERFQKGTQYTMAEGPKVSFWLKSPEGQNLDGNYRSIVLEYKKRHPEVKSLSESEPHLEAAFLDHVQNFGKWLDEYLARKNDPKQSQNNRAGEITSYKSYLAEGYLANAYEKLNDRERDAMFNWDFELGDTALEIGRKVGTVFMGDKKVWSYWPRNPRREFEEYLHTPQERDYMSGWSISQEFDRLKIGYEDELSKRGFMF